MSSRSLTFDGQTEKETLLGFWMGGGIFTSPLIIVILIARFTAYSSIDFAALADSSASLPAQQGPKSSLPSQQPHSIVKRQRSFVAPADPAVIEKQFVTFDTHANSSTEPSTCSTRKPNRTSRQLDSPLLPSLVNVNTPRIAIHRRLDFIHHTSLIRSTRFRPRSAANPKNLIAPQSSEPARSISTTTNGVCVRAGRRAGDVPNSTFSWKRLRPHRSYCRQSRQSPKSVVDMLSLESSSNCHYDVIAPVCCRYYTVFLVISFMLTVIARFNYRHSFIS